MSKQPKRLKPIPKLATEDAEAAFWDKTDSTDYIDWSKAERVALSHLRPSTETISLRLPAGLLEGLRSLANRRDVPYQSLLKIYLAERVELELSRLGRSGMVRDRNPVQQKANRGRKKP
jgi:predicted DNA binding CopG/RHH family protein